MSTAQEIYIPTVGDSTVIGAAEIGSRLGWLAAVCWVILGVESIVRPEQENYRDGLWMVPWVITAVTICYVHGVNRARPSGLEMLGFWVLIVSMALVFLGNLGLLIDAPMLAVLSFPFGALLWIVTMLVFGVATWKTKVLPWYVGLALILFEPLSIATGLALSPIAPLHDRGGYSAGVEKGVAIAVIAVGMRAFARAARSHEERSA